MHYRPFGKTGLSISAIGFGCGKTGGLLISGSDADRRLAVRRALDGGINWCDTAADYGDGKSEEALGRLRASGSRWAARAFRRFLWGSARPATSMPRRRRNGRDRFPDRRSKLSSRSTRPTSGWIEVQPPLA
ncbi:MAG: hypothetical protein RL477_246 [Pseudomonadota bacterium]|jgi:hypothetical protein